MPARTPDACRRLVILAEGQFGEPSSKTAIGVIRYGPHDVVAVLDSTRAGHSVAEWLGPDHDIPVVASLDEVAALAPTELLIGIAPRGGRIPPDWRATIVGAIEMGLDIVSGLHELVSEDPELVRLAARRGVELTDHRRAPDRHELPTGRAHRPGSRVVLSVGTDCAVGKMTVSLELRAAALRAGLSAAFVPTGQTGIMIEGWGVSVDGVISDFMNGTVEWLVERGEGIGDWVFVEGQGSLDHPAYSPVTLGLVHGATPHAMVLVHQSGRTHHAGWEARTGHAASLKSLQQYIRLYESVAGVVSPSRVEAIALNTSLLSEAEARVEVERVAAATGLPADDPVRFGAERLFADLRASLEGPPPVDEPPSLEGSPSR